MTKLAQLHLLEGTSTVDLAESPVWDDRRQRLYWIDIRRGELHWIDSTATHAAHLQVGDTVGFVVLTDEPDQLVVGRNGEVCRVHVRTGEIEVLAPLDSAGGRLRCNDGKCDPTGRLWVGTAANVGTTPQGTLYSFAGDFRLVRHRTGTGCSNGLAWNVHRGEFFFIDSPTRRIDRYRWQPETGTLSQHSVLVRFNEQDGWPDGMTIDVEGNLWVAFWGGGCVRRIHGQTGTELARIHLPAAQVTSCTLGGPDLDDLFITTAHPEPAAILDPSAAAGRVYRVSVNVPGHPADRFPTGRKGAR